MKLCFPVTSDDGLDSKVHDHFGFRTALYHGGH